MIEKEIRGEIALETFLLKKKEFLKHFGEPRHYKRLALLMFDRNCPEIDTRVRITNGMTEIMQKIKIKPDNNKSSVTEVPIPIGNDPEEIYNTYQVLKNLHSTRDQQQVVYISAETENFIWTADNYELKLSHLSGKFDFYNYEIEARKNNVDLEKIESELELVDELNFSGEESKKRRRELAIKLDEISKEEFIKLIKKYL